MDTRKRSAPSPRPARTDVPGGFDPSEVPLFVCVTFDDNGYSGLPESGHDGGMAWFLDLFGSRANPAGRGDPATFDGTPPRAAFYIKTASLDGEGLEAPDLLAKVYRRAVAEGHELGSHTRNHPHGVDIDWESYSRIPALSKADWLREMDASLASIEGLGARGPDGEPYRVVGFRTPYLEYNSEVFAAEEDRGFLYDTSIEEGWQEELTGRKALWPYTLHAGSPGEAWMSRKLFSQDAMVGSHPRLWEVPVSTLSVPADEDCARYGVAPGLRKRILPPLERMRFAEGKVIGFDWNLFIDYGLSGPDVAAVLCHSLDERLAGNRAPLVLGAHTDIYSPLYELNDMSEADRAKSGADPAQRRDAWRVFVDYALSKSDVRLIRPRDLVAWMESPRSLSGAGARA